MGPGEPTYQPLEQQERRGSQEPQSQPPEHHERQEQPSERQGDQPTKPKWKIWKKTVTNFAGGGKKCSQHQIASNTPKYAASSVSQG